MSARPWLTLIVPGAGTLIAQSAHTGVGAPQLAHWAGRGSLECKWHRRDAQQAAHRPWQRALLAVLALEPARLASAPVSVFGSAVAVAPVSDVTPAQSSSIGAREYWMHLEPVHFAAGLDRLTFLPLAGEAQVHEAERDALVVSMRGHLHESGMHLQVLADGSWGVRCAAPLDVQTFNPEFAAAEELHVAMPRGAGAGVLRRTMTELQMLLHSHPVNDARARRGLPAINAAWFWGGGMLSDDPGVADLPRMFADASYVRGIYALYSAAARLSPAPSTAEQLIGAAEDSGRVVAVIAASEVVAAFETDWIGPITAALSSRRLARLDFILDGWRLALDVRSPWRFWRKPRQPAEWLS